MSATGRGAVRRDADWYPTPPWCTHRLLDAVRLPSGDWLEPSAGDGAIMQAVNAVRPGVRWTACDVRPECEPTLRMLTERVVIGDFLRQRWERRFDVAILNPPYSLALPFVERCRSLAEHVVALLRLNWLASEERASWLRRFPPSVYVLPNRPSFTGEGTDATDYAWLHWSGRSPTVRVLDLTSAEERNADPRQLTLVDRTPPVVPQPGLFGGVNV